MNIVCMATVSRPKAYNFIFVDIEGHLPLFRPMDGLVRVLLEDFVVCRREGIAKVFTDSCTDSIRKARTWWKLQTLLLLPLNLRRKTQYPRALSVPYLAN